jgi:nitroimidazol reductase NimA-like FMN-containing flavoprotein (pyridoxamine 5'-phosphate oxidase superfamily)
MTSRGLERLTAEECLDLLRAHTLGRVAIHIVGAPVILPVNYALLDDDVVFRTDPGSKLYAALMKMMVAFEVDEIDTGSRTGSSVLVTGYVEEIRDPETLARVEELALDPWVVDGRDYVVRIDTRTITGRRVLPQ